MSVKKKVSRSVWHEPLRDHSSTSSRNDNCSEEASYDFVEPEDSIRNMISDNDFYRFVLFKQHYEKYIHLSQKYEETKNMVYNLEEKYCEVKAERDELNHVNMELEEKLQSYEHDLLDKDSELFSQMEKVIRLEEDIEKLISEKNRLVKESEQLEKEKKEALEMLQKQSTDSELIRRRIETGRLEIVRKLTEIAKEKTEIESENAKLKKELLLAEQRNFDKYFSKIHLQRRRVDHNVEGLQKQVSDLKLVARRSASLGSQFRKGMKHIANCQRSKCTVCEYTKAIFGATTYERQLDFPEHKTTGILSCFPFPQHSPKTSKSSSENIFEEERADSLSVGSEYLINSSPVLVKRNSSSEHSLLGTRDSSTTSHNSYQITDDNVLSYIDEVISNVSDTTDENAMCFADDSEKNCQFDGATNRPFSHDSGFYSESNELRMTPAKNECDIGDKLNDCDKKKLERSKWTRSFRKFISKVAKK